MKSLVKAILVLSILSFFSFGYIFSSNSEEINKTFKSKKSITMKTASGSCIVRKGKADEIKVRVVYTYSKEDFDAEFEESDDELVISEKFNCNHCSGKSTWYLDIPETTNIEFSTGSGNFSAEDLNGDFNTRLGSGNVKVKKIGGELKVSTGSGNVSAEDLSKKSQISSGSGKIEIKNSAGDVKISTGSGRIKADNLKSRITLSTGSGEISIQNSYGEFTLSAGSGDIEAESITIGSKSSFSTGSGNIEVKLAKSSEFDLKLSSGSGNSTLKYGGNPISGYFEFSANKDRGAISSPIKFDKEETYTSGNNEYMRKSFTKGNAKPVIKISTGSGTAELVE